MLIIFFISYLASKRTNNVADYLLGNRQFNALTTALAAGASGLSGWVMLALPGVVYINGLHEIWMVMGIIIGGYLNWALIAKRLRIYSSIANNALTVPEFLHNRFGSHQGQLRLAVALISLFFFTIYAASGLVGFALLFKELFHLPYNLGLWFGFGSIVFYTCIGGFIAVNWIDAFQGSLMLLSLITLPLIMWFHLHESYDLIHHLIQVNPNYFSVFHNISVIKVISLLGWGLGFFGQLHVVVRFMAVRRSQEIDLARAIAVTWKTLCLFGGFSIGLLGAILYVNPPLEKPETVFFHATTTLLPPLIVGVLVAAVLSAIMSSISAQLLICSSTLVEDIYIKYFKSSVTIKHQVRLNRSALVIIAFIALLLAAELKSSVMGLVSYAWSGLGATFGPVILFSLYCQKMTYRGALLGMILGALTTIGWKILASVSLSDIFQLYEIIPGFIACSLGIYLGSLYDIRHNQLSYSIIKQHNLFLKSLN
ncbi:sodium/proline symporter [Piscirickettsia salmonis]|uniref:sodium/proline symporter n=1 Tax=Piscirickettsia salmonis TaxID=1238 RepID=UPI0018AD0992|nr:sodium/proline symporter [Piscirickettsia salmonis]